MSLEENFLLSLSLVDWLAAGLLGFFRSDLPGCFWVSGRGESGSGVGTLAAFLVEEDILRRERGDVRCL